MIVISEGSRFGYTGTPTPGTRTEPVADSMLRHVSDIGLFNGWLGAKECSEHVVCWLSSDYVASAPQP